MKILASITAALGLCAAFASQAAAPSASSDYQRLASNEAYVLVGVDARGALGHYVSSLNFSDKRAGIRMTIPKQSGMQLVKVKAGTYQPKALALASRGDKTKTRALPQKYTGEGIEIEAGTITYIGNWNLRYGQRVRWIDSSHLVDVAEYGVHFAPRDVEKFYHANQWVSDYPLRVAHMNGKRVAAPWIFNDKKEGANSRPFAQLSR
ncbi:MAG: hypothetical protein KJP25_04205 [Gammaproteobacteria bacterium]|nr:hypothetical protein [Gammaproteobacteria bacterium]NND40205.1 hypothetical protein [Pseudomonadales bacterium]NNL10427.1 hypothetical protein [Pseudomonadales bacterium]NNM12226.1 hypothetical protein [Pseudomonadales bacterium]RZV58538.1 MAG: hypothetical protein EX270_02540 [Pseudomonadales bacterium]